MPEQWILESVPSHSVWGLYSQQFLSTQGWTLGLQYKRLARMDKVHLNTAAYKQQRLKIHLPTQPCTHHSENQNFFIRSQLLTPFCP